MAKVYEVDMFPYCPTSEFGCPYYSEETDRCMMFEEENVSPYNECENFFDEEPIDADYLLMIYTKEE